MKAHKKIFGIAVLGSTLVAVPFGMCLRNHDYDHRIYHNIHQVDFKNLVYSVSGLNDDGSPVFIRTKNGYGKSSFFKR